MSEDAKKSGGAPAVKPTSDDRRISSGSVPSPTGTKVTIKSADMKPDVQKEAVDIAIAVYILSLLCRLQSCLLLQLIPL